MTDLDRLVTRALADAAPTSYWTDRPGAPDPAAPVTGHVRADLAVVGGGLTGLWAAILAKQADPGRDVVVVEGHRVAHGASGRNGGFVSDSLTHGLAHGASRWPRELDELLRLGRENLAALAATLTAEGIDAGLRLCGKTVVATRPHEVPSLATAHALADRHGEDADLLDAEEVRKDIDSPTYLAGLRIRSGGGLVDPARLTWGLVTLATRLGVRIHESTPVSAIERTGAGVALRTDRGRVHARRAVLGTNAFPPLLRRLRHFMIPVYDHVLVTEPLSADQLAAIGWRDNQGITDAGNQFHYYRRTPDDRILFGGYDAVYYRGGRTGPALEQREASHRLLAEHLYATFPILRGIGFTHRWAGIIDTTSRFTPMFGTALGGRVAYAVGYTGLGVASTRFGAQVALDLLDGRETDRTALSAVVKRPVPFPPEPVRYPVVQLMRDRLAREDETGRRGATLRLLDRFGVGFDS